MFNIKDGVRNAKNSAILTTVEDMIDAIDADSFRLVERNEGGTYLHVFNSETGDYFPIKVGSKVEELPEGKAAIKTLVNDYVIYCGQSDATKYSGNAWFTFGLPATGNEPLATMTVKELLGKKSVASAKA